MSTLSDDFVAEWDELIASIRHAARLQARALTTHGDHPATAATIEASDIAVGALLGLAAAARRL